VIFGTETTIGSDAHRSQLLTEGIPPERLATQACPDLAGMIESDASGSSAKAAIDAFSFEAAGKLQPGTDTVFAGLCCTHYGYCGGEFASALGKHTGRPVEIVDPTQEMSEMVLPPGRARRSGETRILVSVISRAAIPADEVESIGGLLEKTSPATTTALRRYLHKRDLFPYQPE
jgi:glutamate racemase